MKLLMLLGVICLIIPMKQMIVNDTVPYYLDMQLQQAYQNWFNNLSVHN